VHAALERLPLDTLAADALARVRALAREELAALLRVDADERAAAVHRVDATCDGLGGGVLLERLLGDAYEVLARELPVLLPPDDQIDEAVGSPVGYVAGSVDLVLRERASGALVVVDHKSDAVTAEEVEAVAAAYAPQLRAYGRALRLALGLDRAPRLEAWFLALDRAVAVEP